MKYFAIALYVCPLIAQVGSADLQPTVTPFPLAAAVPFVNPPKSEGNTLYRWSLAAATLGSAADTFSSWGHPEANPLLANNGSNFDTRSVMLKSALLGASFLIEYYALRHNPHLYRHFAWLNFAIAGALGGAAAHNIMLPVTH
jgi:hypothetical protein